MICNRQRTAYVSSVFDSMKQQQRKKDNRKIVNDDIANNNNMYGAKKDYKDGYSVEGMCT